jgi:hypothetical protein
MLLSSSAKERIAHRERKDEILSRINRLRGQRCHQLQNIVKWNRLNAQQLLRIVEILGPHLFFNLYYSPQDEIW